MNLDDLRRSSTIVPELKKIFSTDQSRFKPDITKNTGILIRKEYIKSSPAISTSVPSVSSMDNDLYAGKSQEIAFFHNYVYKVFRGLDFFDIYYIYFWLMDP